MPLPKKFLIRKSYFVNHLLVSFFASLSLTLLLFTLQTSYFPKKAQAKNGQVLGEKTLLAKIYLKGSSPTTPSQIQYGTANLGFDASGDGTAEITIESGGNVGIGTTDPSDKLNVIGNTTIASSQDITDFFQITNDDTNTTFNRTTNGGTTGNVLSFNSAGTANFPGYVGIGTTNPAVPLDVASGGINSGTVDTVQGYLSARGSTTLEGGQITLDTAADSDTTYNEWNIDAYQDDLRFFTAAGGVELTIDPTGTITGTNYECTTCIDQGDLKTTSSSINQSKACGSAGYTAAHNHLPGGEYGFYPRTSTTQCANWNGSGYAFISSALGGSEASHAVQAHLYMLASVSPTSTGTFTITAEQRYIQASPPYFIDGYHIKHFIYYLRNKNEPGSISGYQAPDPPWENNGGDPNLVPHPFADYEIKPLPENMEISMIDPEEVEIWKQEAKMKGIDDLLKFLEYYYEVDPADVPLPISPETGKPIRLPKDCTWRRLKLREVPQLPPAPPEILTPQEEKADLSEFYGDYGGSLLEKGDIVDIHPKSEIDKNKVLTKSEVPYSSKIAGIISSNPAQILITQGISEGLPLALVGRVPVKVSTINGPVESSDPITSSEIRGVGMKATRAGPIVGKALEPFDGNEGKPCPDHPELMCGEVKAFINLGWYDPDVYLTDTGNLSIESSIVDGITKYELKDKEGNLIARVGAFAEIAAAKIKAGLIQTKKLTVDDIDILEKLNQLSDKVTSQQTEIDSLKKDLETLKKK